jgi:VWFA-related protein
MQDSIEALHEAAGAFVETLRPDDRALIIDFDDRVFLVQDLTSDHTQLKEAIESTEALGGTAIYDALHAAYRKIGQIDGRKAIVILSDGDDTASQMKLERVLEEARTNNTVIFSIALGAGDRTPLKQLAEATGGRLYAVSRASELGDVYTRIAEELRAQFFLAYETSNEAWDGRFVPVEVKSSRRGVKVRSRSGYYAVRAEGLSGS